MDKSRTHESHPISQRETRLQRRTFSALTKFTLTSPVRTHHKKKKTYLTGSWPHPLTVNDSCIKLPTVELKDIQRKKIFARKLFFFLDQQQTAKQPQFETRNLRIPPFFVQFIPKWRQIGKGRREPLGSSRSQNGGSGSTSEFTYSQLFRPFYFFFFFTLFFRYAASHRQRAPARPVRAPPPA